MSSLFFVDGAEQAAWFVKQNTLSDKSLKLLSTGPTTHDLLSSAGKESKITESYLAPEKFVKSGVGHFQLADAVCDQIDRVLNMHSEYIRSEGIHPGKWHFPSFKILFDSVFTKIQEACAVVEQEKPADVVSIQSQPLPPVFFAFVTQAHSFWPQILDLVTRAKGIRRTVIPRPSVAAGPSRMPLRFRLLKHRWILWIRTVFKTYGTRLAIGLRRVQNNRPAILFLNVDYDIRTLIHKIMGEKILNLAFWYSQSESSPRWLFPLFGSAPAKPSKEILNLAPDLQKAWQELRANQEFRRGFIYREIDFFPIFEEQFRFYFETVLPVAIDRYRSARAFFNQNNVKGVMTFGLSDSRDYAIYEAAQKEGARRIVYAHGPYAIPFSNLNYYFDYRNCDDFLSWGPGSQADVAKFPAPHPRVIDVGSSRLEALSRESRTVPSGKTTVLCVLFPISENFRYIDVNMRPQRHIVLAHQKSLVRSLAGISDTQILVKLFPNILSMDPLQAWIEKSAFPNVRVNKWTPFTKFLPEANVVVSDYMETPVFESLALNKRVVIYTNYYPDTEKRPFGESVTFANDEAQFRNLVTAALKVSRSAPPPNGVEFLKALGYLRPNSQYQAYQVVKSLLL